MKKIRLGCLLGVMTAVAVPLTSCGKSGVKLDPNNPTTVSLWTYYSSSILKSFKDQVSNFNDTYGKTKGIIVEVSSYPTVASLEAEVIAAAKKEVGSKDLPNILFSYADTAYEIEKLGVLADIEKYFSKSEQNQYMESYIEEGKIGLNGELRIFPFAKSTETFLINDTDWADFAEDEAVSYNDLKTIEGVAEVAKKYYEWSDGLTPDIDNDGKAFFGRDTLANFLIISAKELDEEIFQVMGGEVTINVDRSVMKKIWDNYYVPILSGHFIKSSGYCSDDLGSGKILSYVGSTASASHFPTVVQIEVEDGDDIEYPIASRVLPVPHFKDAPHKSLVQQGAGMVVTKGTPEQEFASVSFLKWITDIQPNIQFAVEAGYLPVKKVANDYDTFMGKVEALGLTVDDITKNILQTSFNELKTNALYTNKAFSGGVEARKVLTYNLHDKVTADRAEVIRLIGEGVSLEDAVAQFNTTEAFDAWLAVFTGKLEAAIAKK